MGGGKSRMRARDIRDQLAGRGDEAVELNGFVRYRVVKSLFSWASRLRVEEEESGEADRETKHFTRVGEGGVGNRRVVPGALRNAKQTRRGAEARQVRCMVSGLSFSREVDHELVSTR
jgi:hypothetical protein